MMEDRRASYATSASGIRKGSGSGNPAMAAFEANRRPSLKEIPSYRDEASQHLNRREDVKSISARLSAGKEILNADPATKPWMRKSSSPRKPSSGSSTLERVNEVGGTFTATPAVAGSQQPASPPSAELRTRNLSRSTTASSEGSYNSEPSYFEF